MLKCLSEVHGGENVNDGEQNSELSSGNNTFSVNNDMPVLYDHTLDNNCKLFI